MIRLSRNHQSTAFRPNTAFFIIAGLIIAATLAIYWQVHNFEFLSYDDDDYITQNPNILLGLSAKGLKWAFTFYVGNWHPLTWLSHLVDYELFGMNPAAPHIINVLLHLVNTVLLFWLFLRMTKTLWPSAFVAALFALHPLHVESVAWIAERKDVLSTFFWFLTMIAYVRYTESKTALRYAMIIVFSILGLMAKPMLVTLPFVLLLMDYWPLNRLSKNAVLEKLPLFALSACSSVVTFFAQKSGGAVLTTQALPIHLRLGNALVSYELYLSKMLWPVRLAVFYPHPITNLAIQSITFAAINLFLICFLVIRFRHLKWLTFGWLWYLGTLVPVIGIVQVGSQAMADRYTYIPLVGIFIIIAWAAYELFPPLRYRNLILASSVIVILFALAARSYNQLGYWRNNIALYEHSLSVTKDNPILRYNLALRLTKMGHKKEALEQFLRCYKMEPLKPETNYELGLLYNKQGDTDKAILYFNQAIHLKPDYVEAHNNLAVMLLKLENFDEAIEHFKEALRLRPNELMGIENLAQAVNLKKKYIAAKELYEKAVGFDKKGDFKNASLYYRMSLEAKPTFYAAASNLALILAACKDKSLRNSTEAVALMEKICQLTHYKQPVLLDTLAVAYAANDNFPRAVETAQKAIDLAGASNDLQLMKKIAARLELYKKGIQPTE